MSFNIKWLAAERQPFNRKRHFHFFSILKNEECLTNIKSARSFGSGAIKELSNVIRMDINNKLFYIIIYY